VVPATFLNKRVAVITMPRLLPLLNLPFLTILIYPLLINTI
jgi:hypothetical protein